MVRGKSIRRQQDMVRLGDCIRRWRKLHRLTTQMVAERAGITRDTLRAIENGDGGVRLENVVSVLRVLGVMGAVLEAVEPMNSEVGVLNAESMLPQRVTRPRRSTEESRST